MILRKRNIKWARQWLEPGIRSVFAYTLKRNYEFGISTTVLDKEEYYAVLRQTMTKHDIERMLHITVEVV